MDAGDCLARIAESQVNTRGDLQSGRAALYGYLMATDATLAAFGPRKASDPTWDRPGFGSASASRYNLLGRGENDSASRSRLLDSESAPESPVILRLYNWCAAFVDWCVLQLLLSSPNATSLSLVQRPTTASAYGLLPWGKKSGCTVFNGNQTAPLRGDIAIFNFSHTGIVVQSGSAHFHSMEGNTTPGDGGNQGYLVARRLRSQRGLKGVIRLPPKYRAGDYNISPRIAHTV